jgi:hypothetical protein
MPPGRRMKEQTNAKARVRRTVWDPALDKLIVQAATHENL